MATAKGNPKQYLKRIGGKWYVNVRVPRTLEKPLGTTHIRRTLRTGDLAEANRLKHAPVAEIKAELAALRSKAARGEPLKRGLTFDTAAAIRTDLEDARAQQDEDREFILTSEANKLAHEVARLHGDATAHRFYRKATRTEPSMRVLSDKWLDNTDYKGVTKDAHREALAGLLEYLGDEDAMAMDVSRMKASEYVDEGLGRKGLAQRTIRRKINSLSAFWEWLEVKGHAPAGANPWKGHKISRTKHKGTRAPRRIWTDKELIAALKGPPANKRRTSAGYLRDLTVLGLFTGARLDELCKLRPQDVQKHPTGYVLRIEDAKTKAGNRLIGVVHEAPKRVLARRVKAAKGGRLFPELKPTGIDKKLSHEAAKRFSGYRRACGVEDGPCFHTFRNQVETILERADVPEIRIDRFVGHKTGRIGGDVYSAGGSEAQALDTARHVRYEASVEAAALAAS
jgi:integrase